MVLIVEPLKGSKLAIIGIGAAGIIAAVAVFRALDRPDERLKATRVEPTSMLPETAPAPGEKLDPVARSAPAEPMPPPIERRLLPAPPTGRRVQAPARPDDPELLDDTATLAKLHDLAASDPAQSLTLAREALARFPDSANATEFEWNAVKALFNMGRIEDAKDEARIMVRNYPESDFTVDVERHLLNPQPNQ